MPMAGTPLDGQPPVDIFQLVRLIATTRLVRASGALTLAALALWLLRFWRRERKATAEHSS